MMMIKRRIQAQPILARASAFKTLCSAWLDFVRRLKAIKIACKNVFFPRTTVFPPRFHRHQLQRWIQQCEFMYSPRRGSKLGVFCALGALAPTLIFAAVSYNKSGSEFPVTGPLRGDQMRPHLKLNSSGGFLVWEDNITDGKGLGISAIALNNTFSKVGPAFRVNEIGKADQEHAQVGLLKD